MKHMGKTGGNIATQALRAACESVKVPVKDRTIDLSGMCKGAIIVIAANVRIALADAVRQHACVAAKFAYAIVPPSFSVIVVPLRAEATNGKHCFGIAPLLTVSRIPSRNGGCAYHWTRYLKLVPKPWMRGADVTALQKRLKASGAKLSIDSVFGPETDKALRHFQQTHGLRPDGVAGPLTWAKLNKVCP
jgi:hypothetical protein